MDLNSSFIGIAIAFGLSIFFLYTRKKKWMPAKYVWLICFGLCTVGILGLLTTKTALKVEQLMFYGFCVPLIYWIFDRIFKQISLRVQKRDFILYLRNSEEINDGFLSKNKHVKPLDMLFSFGLVAIIVVAIFIGVYFIQR